MSFLKRRLILLLTVCFAFCLSFLAVGCKGKCSGETPVIPPVVDTNFSLNYTSKELSLFDTVQLRVKNYTDLIWESDNTAVATVDKNGLVTANGIGNANINVSRGEQKTSCLITVLDEGIVPSLVINVDGESLSLVKSEGVSDTFGLQCAIAFNGKTYSDGTFTFVPSKSGVIEIDSNGVISAVDYGSVDLNIKGSWRNFEQVFIQKTITVNVVHNVSMSMSLKENLIYTVDEEIQGRFYSNRTELIKTFVVDGVDVTNSGNVFYEISDQSVIELSNDSEIVGKKYGSSKIVAKIDIDGVEYSSLPLTVEIVRPTVVGEKTCVIEKSDAFEVDGIVGAPVSFVLDNEEHLQNVSVFSNTISLDKAFFSEIRGEQKVKIETDVFVYDYDVLFVTHTISTLDELKDYISAITTDDSADDYAILTNDIDCEGYKFKNSSSDVQWYKGHFDGRGYAIKNYDADSKGLFGCRLVAGPTIENLALYFYAGSSSSVALAERAWNVGQDKVYIKNVYVKIYSDLQINGLLTGGEEGQCYVMDNVIIDVSGAIVQYAIDDSDRGTAYVNQVYAVGSPLSGSVMRLRGQNYNEYTGTLCSSQQELYTDYALNINSINGFNKYWKVESDGIYFGQNKVVSNLPIYDENTLYRESWQKFEMGDKIDSNTQAVYINGIKLENFNSIAQIEFSAFVIGSYNVVEIQSSDKITQYPLVAVTSIIDSGAEFLHVLNGYYNVSASAANGSKDTYYVLGTDIVLSKSGSTDGVWSTNSNWNFEQAHFNGLGYKIDCSFVTIVGDGIFGDIRFSTIENVAIINATVNSGKPVVASNAWGGATLSNIYVECSYNGGNSVGLLATGEANVKNCVVKLSPVATDGENYALSKGVFSVDNCCVISNLTMTTSLEEDNTLIYLSDLELFNEAEEVFVQAKGFNRYWTIKNDGVYLGETLVVSKN